MTETVLDASALLALLKAEPGADAVLEAIAESHISAVNLAEVVSHFVHAGMPQQEVRAMLKPLPMVTDAVDEEMAFVAGELRAVTARAGLSLGDRFCLALAQRLGVPAMTADRQWHEIADAVAVPIIFIR